MVRQITVSQVAGVLQQLVVRQARQCAICSKPFTQRDYAVLDHDHDSGYIRGAIHNSCNGAEGRVKTKAYLGHKGVSAYTYLIGLGKYLEHHSMPKVNLIHPSHMTEEQKRVARNNKAKIARAKAKTK